MPTSRWYNVQVSPVHGHDRVAIVFDDVTARKHAEPALRASAERQAFLLTLSDTLRAEPDADAVADRALQMLIEHMRLDRSYIVSYRLADDRAYLVHQRGNDTVPPLPDVFVLSDYPAAFRATLDRTFVIEDEREREGLSEAERRNSGRLGMRALVSATVRKGQGRPLWSLAAVSAHPRHWTADEIALVEETAERTWAAVERARAEHALRASEAHLARDLADMEHLQRLSSLLIKEDDISALYAHILDAACALMRADTASLQMLVPERNALVLLAHKGLAPASARYWHWVQPDDASSCALALERGAPVIVPDVERWEEMAGTEDLTQYRLSGIRATHSTPLVARDGRAVGMISTHWHTMHQPAEKELRLLDVLARQAADVIERRRAADALRASEQRFRSFAESSADTLWIVDAASGQVEYLSPAFERMWGMARDVILRDPGRWAELVHPEDRARAEQPLPLALARTAGVVDYRIVRPATGEVRWIRGTAFAIRDAQGAVTRYGGIAQDISDQKEAEAALRAAHDVLERRVAERTAELAAAVEEVRASQEQHAYLLRLSDALGPLADPVEIQRTACRVLGEHTGADRVLYGEVIAEREVVIHHNYVNGMAPLVGRLHAEDFGAATVAAYKRNEMVIFSDVASDLRFSDAERRSFAAIDVAANASLGLVKEGRWVAAFGLHQATPRAWTPLELTLLRETAERTWEAVERARAEEALRVSEERLRLLVEQMPAALWTTDRELRLTALMGAAVPPSAQAGLGQTMPDFLYADAGNAAGITAAVEAHRRALAGVPSGFEAETAAHTYAGHVEPLRDGAGHIVGVIGVAHDVTERALLRLQDEFLALASHELRTPLTPTMGYLEMALTTLNGATPSPARRYVARAVEQVGRLNELVGDLLDVGRLRGGKMALEREEIDLDVVVRRAVEMAEIEAGAQGQTITLETFDAPLLVHGDARRLEQVALNLLTNAIRYAAQSPTIAVRLGRDTEAGQAVLEVADAGPGIAAADLPHLFSRFYQVARADRPSRGGLGLGLYLVQQLVEAHGGTVAVASVVGVGTTFAVRLPLAGAGAALPAPDGPAGTTV